MILIDTSAVVAIENSNDQHHASASKFFANKSSSVRWCSVNVTAHEAYTYTRYKNFSVARAIEHYDFLRAGTVQLLSFIPEDEAETRKLLLRYHDQKLSFHDVLCASVMLRVGIFKVFTFDKDFRILGFEVVPGVI